MRILIIEDNVDLCDAMCFHLINEGYDVDICNDGEDGLSFIKQDAYGLIILDRMLPSLNGIKILKELRNLGIKSPLIMVTALNGIGDRVEGLDTGADDYLVKPFAMDELIARIRALCRRPALLESSQILNYGDIILDITHHHVKGPVSFCSLSNRETQLLEVLIRGRGQTIPREIIISRVWGPYAPIEDGNLDNYIHFLRRRLKSIGSKLNIKTARALGYRLEENNA